MTTTEQLFNRGRDLFGDSNNIQSIVQNPNPDMTIQNIAGAQMHALVLAAKYSADVLKWTQDLETAFRNGVLLDEADKAIREYASKVG